MRQVSAYKSDLDAAHARIKQLEAELKVKESKPRRAWIKRVKKVCLYHLEEWAVTAAAAAIILLLACAGGYGLGRLMEEGARRNNCRIICAYNDLAFNDVVDDGATCVCTPSKQIKFKLKKD